MYCITVFGTLLQASLAALKQLDSPDSTNVPIVLCNTVYYAVLLMTNDKIRSKHAEQTKNCGIKLIIRIVHLVGLFTHCGMLHGTHSIRLTHCNMMHGTHSVKIKCILCLCD